MQVKPLDGKFFCVHSGSKPLIMISSGKGGRNRNHIGVGNGEGKEGQNECHRQHSS